MKTKYKSIFFLIFFFISVNSFILFASAGEIDDPIIDTDIFTVGLGDFQDSDGDGTGRFKSATGGKDLISFENMGEYSRDLETNQILYWGKAKFGLEIDAWTACLLDDIYPNMVKSGTVEQTYFEFKQYTHWTDLGCLLKVDYGTEGNWQYFSFNYKEIDYGDTHNHHRYIGNLLTTIKIRPGMKYDGEITLGGATFTVPTLTGDILNTKIVSVRGGECGDYDDIYTDEGFDETYVDIEAVGEDLPDTTQDALDIIEEQGIGLTSKGNIYHSDTNQEAVRDLGCEGENMYDLDDAYDTMKFNLPVDIQPRVEQYSQVINYKYGQLAIFTCCGILQRSPVLANIAVERVVSSHVYNQFVHYELEFDTDIFMTCQFDAQISESTLSDPNLYISDMLWDLSIMGTEGVTIIIPIEPSWLDDLWNNLLMIIITIAVIGISLLVIIKIIIPHYSKKAKEGKLFSKYSGKR